MPYIRRCRGLVSRLDAEKSFDLMSIVRDLNIKYLSQMNSQNNSKEKEDIKEEKSESETVQMTTASSAAETQLTKPVTTLSAPVVTTATFSSIQS